MKGNTTSLGHAAYMYTLKPLSAQHVHYAQHGATLRIGLHMLKCSHVYYILMPSQHSS